MLSIDEKQLIRNLRAAGHTYPEICMELGREVPKSTLSYICKDVILPADFASKMKLMRQTHARNIQKLATAKNKELNKLRLDAIEARAIDIVKSEQLNDWQKIHLAMLYLGEGSKYSSYRGLSLGSSDPSVLQIYMQLLEICYGKNRGEFRARVQYRADQKLEILEEYWSGTLGIPREHFYKSSPDKRSVGKPTRNIAYKGVCVVSCSGADIQLELAAIARHYSQHIWGVSSFG